MLIYYRMCPLRTKRSHWLPHTCCVDADFHLIYCHPLDDEDNIAPSEAARLVKHLNKVLNQFWRRWRRECLLELRECHQYSWEKEATVSIEVGDIVLLQDDYLPMSFWKLVRVVELLTRCDRKTSRAVVKVPNKSGQTTTLRHPLQLLYPLELKCKDQYEHQGESAKSNHKTAKLTVEPEDHAINPAGHPDDQETRPQQWAATNARGMMSAYLLKKEDSETDWLAMDHFLCMWSTGGGGV